MDYVGPISPLSIDGHSYILINVDYLLRFLIATACRLATGEEVCEIWWWRQEPVPMPGHELEQVLQRGVLFLP